MKQGDKLNAFQSGILGLTSTFEDFARLEVTIADAYGIKSVQRNQIEYLTDERGKMIVNSVGRFECQEADFAQAMAGRWQGDSKLGKQSSSYHVHYTYYYSLDLANYVGRVYARDIDAFGYRFGE